MAPVVLIYQNKKTSFCPTYHSGIFIHVKTFSVVNMSYYNAEIKYLRHHMHIKYI